MKEITHAEFDRLGAGGVMALVNEGKESVGLINPTTGKVSMVIHYMPPTPPCECPPGLQHWICLHCDGYVRTVPSPSNTEGKL